MWHFGVYFGPENEEHSVVAIRAPSNSIELLYLVKVLSKCVADKKMSADGHNIQKGEMYLNGKRISFVLLFSIRKHPTVRMS